VILIFLILFLVGIFTHHASFLLAIYGDEWIDIYEFISENGRDQYPYFSPLPGILKYLAPWGSSFFIVGNLYKIFGTDYMPYYIVSFLFRMFATFSIYLFCQEIGRTMIKQTNSQVKLLSFLIALFFLVSYTGIQNTDWAHYMNIYLASAFYIISTYFQINFYQRFKTKDLWLHLLFITLSLISGSVRMFPLVFAIPVMDFIILLIYRKDYQKVRQIFVKFVGFLLIVVSLWGAGLFGGPFGVYSYGEWSFNKFLSVVISDIPGAIGTYLHWLGVLVVPDGSILGLFSIKLIGSIILLSILVTILKLVKGNNSYLWSAIFGCNFLIFMLEMWYYNPILLIDSSHRYLWVNFVTLLFYLTVILFLVIKNNSLPRVLVYVVLVLLILIHLSSTKAIYRYWLENGRSSEFIKLTEQQIVNRFTSPIKAPVAIYLDVDDARVAHSVIFGLGFKIMVLSKTWDKQFYPVVYDDLKILKKDLDLKKSERWSKEDLIQGVYAYRIRDKRISDITDEVRLLLSQ